MNYKFFENKTCEFYPCHFEGQNCLFCYCPLYWIPIDCGGTYTILKGGMKDCHKCTLPHRKDGWDIIQKKLKEAFDFLNNLK
jgi:Zn-finger protein